MNISEKAAETWLKAIGWHPFKQGNNGAPDFECSNNRWVEVKNIGNGETFSISSRQIKEIKELNEYGNTIYFMIYENNKFFGLFKIENLKWNDVIKKEAD